MSHQQQCTFQSTSEAARLLSCSHDKVYVEVKDLEQAMQAKTAVQAHDSIKADQRTNSWTVCLTCVGFADYLNRKMGPLGESPSCCCSASVAMQTDVTRNRERMW